MAKITITFGGYQGPNSVHTRGGRALMDALRKHLGDAVKPVFRENITKDGHKAADLLSLTESGELDGCYFSSSYLAGRVPELGLFDQHFVVPDRRRAYAVLDGALGQRLAAELRERTGMTVLGYWDNGLRHISARTPIRTPKDCRGLKLRTLDNEDHKRIFNALGFQSMAIDVRDLPAAVKDGTVDAQENPLTNIYNFDLHETHRHITLTQHLLGVALVLFNKAAFDSWPAEVREGVTRAVADATAAQRDFAKAEDAVCTQGLLQDGVEIIELTEEERDAFARTTAPEVAKLRDSLDPDFIRLFEQDLAAAS